MRTGMRYLLIQLPGAAVVGVVLYGAHAWWGLEPWVCVSLFALWVAKDAALYRFVASAYSGEPSKMVGAEKVIGRRATVRDVLDPSGYVRVGSELWRAQSANGRKIPVGAVVRVRAIDGLTLEVEEEDSSSE